MGLVILITGISLILDGIFTNYMPYLVNNLSIYTTMFTVCTLFIIYPLFMKNNKKYYLYSFILGFVYDLFYTNLFFYDALIFLLLAYIIAFIYKNFEITIFHTILCLILIITLYESILAFMILINHLVPITFDKLFYKISHSLISNLIYGGVMFIVIKHLSKKHGNQRINRF